jgi:hypothetical protein
MEHWVVDDAPDGGKWLLYDENSSDSSVFIRVSGPKELAQRVASGLNENQPKN